MLVEASHDEQVAYTTAAQIQPLSTELDHHAPKALRQRAPNGTHASQPARSTLPRRRIIWLLEGGYTSDTRYEEKHREKQDQHRTLIEALEVEGFELSFIYLFVQARLQDNNVVCKGNSI